LDKDQKNKIETTDVGVQVGDPVQASLVVLLEESYAMVKRLHKENMDQKKEIASLRAASANNASSSRGGRSRDGNNSHHSRVSPTSTTMQEQNSRKFPPLPIPSYWHRRSSRYRQVFIKFYSRINLKLISCGSVVFEICIFDAMDYEKLKEKIHYKILLQIQCKSA